MDEPEHIAPGEPPEDAESWTDEEWISWLEATDDPGAGDSHPAGRPRHWSRGRPASMLGAAMLGMHELIYGRRDEIAIVVDAGGEPPGDDLPEVHLDLEHPDRPAVVVHRDDPARPGATDPPEGA